MLRFYCEAQRWVHLQVPGYGNSLQEMKCLKTTVQRNEMQEKAACSPSTSIKQVTYCRVQNNQQLQEDDHRAHQKKNRHIH